MTPLNAILSNYEVIIPVAVAFIGGLFWLHSYNINAFNRLQSKATNIFAYGLLITGFAMMLFVKIGLHMRGEVIYTEINAIDMQSGIDDSEMRFGVFQLVLLAKDLVFFTDLAISANLITLFMVISISAVAGIMKDEKN